MTLVAQIRPPIEAENRMLLLELKQQIAAANCFAPASAAYLVRILLISFVYFAGYAGLFLSPNGFSQLGFAMVVALATVQAGFIAHDVGDGAVTRNPKAAFLLRHYLMSFLSSLSSSYFNLLHRAHHIRLHRGLGAAGHQLDNVNPYEVQWLKRIFAWDGVVFGVAMICLRGLTFKMESIRFVARNWSATRMDRFMMVLHFIFWLVIPITVIGFANAILNYVMVILFGGLYVGTVLVLNHEGMSKVDTLAHLPLLDRTLASTRDLGRSWLSNFLLGGVNNHIEHHLFPTSPVIRLVEARSITETFLRQNGMPHVSTSCSSALVSAFRYFCSITPESRVTQALS